MTTEQSDAKAPITEAIIDLRVEPPDDLTLADLEACQIGEEEAYPHKVNLDLAAESFSHRATAEQVGLLFKSADGKRLFQVHREGFTVNRFAPYPGWRPFQDEARRLWNIYRERVRPRRVIRLAVRYVNRLDLPGLGVELKEYLKTSPEVSAGLLQPLAGFFMRLTVPQADIRGTLLLTEAAATPPGPDTTSILLDIDLFRTDELPPDEEGIWRLFEDLHQRSHEIFEACITENTRRLIG